VLASQARRRGFESHHPLHSILDTQSTGNSSLALTLEYLLLSVLDEKGRRRILLKSKSNDELFTLYKAELTHRVHNQRNLVRYYQILDKYREFLGENPPSSLSAKSFLSQWSDKEQATLHKYAGIIKGFLNWYGEDLDLKIRVPHTVPEYIKDEDVQKLIAAIASKRTHKNTIERDLLIVQLGYKAGLRRAELASLRVRDINIGGKYLMVRQGKGGKGVRTGRYRS